MWRNARVSVIFPTYNERDSIFAAIGEFLATGLVDEVLVVNNNAAAGTDEEVRRTSARLVHEPQQGYGHAIQRGFREATGDLLIVAEPDGTFRGKDVHKLLAYSEDFDVVYGSRTYRQFIWTGANMGLFLRWGNYAVAKLMEFLFNGTNLTDVGCTLRLIKAPALRQIQPDFRVGGSFFGPEMMLLSLLYGQAMVQIPINYTKRVGTSSVTGDPVKAVRLGLRMILLIVEYRLRAFFPGGRFARSRRFRERNGNGHRERAAAG
ncbi:MAG TPA: glycosyltransferase family 2 protein [Chloroflexota bacterium]|jgi:glycosyltransferase involved in cell wall biosynthesis|nr:glycosyltransferase family 2 protein [Chloroflexota bacterium]